MENGFIRISRKFFDNSIWKTARAFSEAEAWIDLIQSARFDGTRTLCSIGGCQVQVGRGEYPASIRFLSRKWGRPEGWVRGFLNKLKKAGMITVNNTQGVSVVHLTNYEEYNPQYTSVNTPANTPSNTPSNTPIALTESELQGLLTQVVTQVLTHPATQTPTKPTKTPEKAAESQHTPNTKNNIIYNNIQENLTTNVVSQKKPTQASADRTAAIAATNSRMEEFYNSLRPFVSVYGKEMVREFFDYWSETNRSQTKMRFEQERTWELKRRLAYWAKRDNNFNSNGNNRKTDSKAEANAYALNKLIEYSRQHTCSNAEGQADTDEAALPTEVPEPW